MKPIELTELVDETIRPCADLKAHPLWFGCCPKAIDVILATNPRYAGAAVLDEDARGLCDPFPNVQMRNVTTDAKLNTAKAIVAERSFNAIDGLDGELVSLILTGATADQLREFREKLSAALTAWREV